jgi:hypothetical protein
MGIYGHLHEARIPAEVAIKGQGTGGQFRAVAIQVKSIHTLHVSLRGVPASAVEGLSDI